MEWLLWPRHVIVHVPYKWSRCIYIRGVLTLNGLSNYLLLITTTGKIFSHCCYLNNYFFFFLIQGIYFSIIQSNITIHLFVSIIVFYRMLFTELQVLIETLMSIFHSNNYQTFFFYLSSNKREIDAINFCISVFCVQPRVKETSLLKKCFSEPT